MDGERLVEVQARLVELSVLAFQSAQVTEDDTLMAAFARIARIASAAKKLLRAASTRPAAWSSRAMLVSVWPSSIRSPVSRWIASAASDCSRPNPRRPCSMFRLPRLPSTRPSWRRSPGSRLIESALSKWSARLVEPPLLGVDDGQAVQHLGLGVAVAQLAIDRERALVGRARLLHRAGLTLHDAELVERVAVDLTERASQRHRLLGVAACLVHAALLRVRHWRAG